MPTLNWIGKEKVLTHHQDVPFRVLEEQYTFRAGAHAGEEADDFSETSDNLIIHGDNLEALKSLLPRYEGRVKCIYIDPPYNTGNEGWVYNDRVNDPKILKWLHAVVGKEGEDLSRHDKWLCMMYPRLRLLHKLLAPDGIIFISLDDNEATNLKLVMDEIFGSGNFIQQIIWKNKYGPGALTKGFGNIHEYIFCYSKTPISSIEAELSKEEATKYKNKDKYYPIRGGYITQPLATKSKDDRPNLVYPIVHNGVEIWPDKQWIWSKERTMDAYKKDWLQINETDGKYSVRFKQYLKDENGIQRKGKPISILTGPYNQDGTDEQVKIFGTKSFSNPKPSGLIQYLLSIVVNGDDNGNGIYLDSFAGSGTTAHAVLNLNKSDGGSRKFILVEMEDYAERITAERVRRVMDGYGDKEGTGGDFTFCTIGPPLFHPDGLLNEAVGEHRIREYVWYSEVGATSEREDAPVRLAPPNPNPYFLGDKDGTAYYFFYDRESLTALDHDFLATITAPAENYVIYADTCLLPKTFMQAKSILFKKIPRDIARF